MAKTEPTPQSSAVTIEPEPLEIKLGEPLSGMALTAHPAGIPGVQAWTFEMLRHRGAVLAIAYSADGSQFATGGEDGTVRLCDPASGKTLRILHGHTAPVRAVAWSPDACYLASADGDGQICLWRIQDGRRLRVLATADLAGSIRLWDATVGTSLHAECVLGHGKGRDSRQDVFGLAFLPDASQLLSAGADGLVRRTAWHCASRPSATTRR